MLFLLLSLICWTFTEATLEGVCRDATVSMSAERLNNSEDYKLRCNFTCLRSHHAVQLWKEGTHEGVTERVSLLNVTPTIPNLTLALIISSTPKRDTAHYFCRTQPPDTVSPYASITIRKNQVNLPTPLPALAGNQTRPSGLLCDCPLQDCSAEGLQSQIWCWLLVGKAAILLFILAWLAAKSKKC